jgi:hypothetical protein
VLGNPVTDLLEGLFDGSGGAAVTNAAQAAFGVAEGMARGFSSFLEGLWA